MRLIVNRRLAGVPGFLLLVLLACPAAAGAQAALDPSFGSGGLAHVANPIGEGTFWAEDSADVAVQPDGKLLVAADGHGEDQVYGPRCASSPTAGSTRASGSAVRPCSPRPTRARLVGSPCSPTAGSW